MFHRRKQTLDVSDREISPLQFIRSNKRLTDTPKDAAPTIDYLGIKSFWKSINSSASSSVL
jgi:hypothetical protein